MVQPHTFLVWQHACLPAVQDADICMQLRLQLDMLGVGVSTACCFSFATRTPLLPTLKQGCANLGVALTYIAATGYFGC